jgi:hypothetical protein
MTRFLDTIPEPWSSSVIERAIFNNFLEAKAAIEDTRGGQLWRSLQELDDSVFVFNLNVTELLDEISLFADRSKNNAFWYEARGSAAEQHTRAVKRKFFNCTSSVMALVDNARNFEKKTPVREYNEQLSMILPIN